jgi:hypothetical protein
MALLSCSPVAGGAGGDHLGRFEKSLGGWQVGQSLIQQSFGEWLVAAFQGKWSSNLCDSEDEPIERIDQDGVIYDPADLPAALFLLEAGEVPGHSYGPRRRLALWLAIPLLVTSPERGLDHR